MGEMIRGNFGWKDVPRESGDGCPIEDTKPIPGKFGQAADTKSPRGDSDRKNTVNSPKNPVRESRVSDRETTFRIFTKILDKVLKMEKHLAGLKGRVSSDALATWERIWKDSELEYLAGEIERSTPADWSARPARYISLRNELRDRALGRWEK